MARPKKKPEYDSDQIAQQLMEAVTDAYLNPPQGMEDDAGHMQLKQLAEEFSMTPLKVRKLLITTDAYQTAISKAVNTLFREGKSVAEIQELTNLSRASVQSYLPYSKTVYKMEERTLLAERLQKYRTRKSEVEKIAEAMDGGVFTIGSISTDQVLQAVELATAMNENGDLGGIVGCYSEGNVSTKVVKIIQSYTGVIDKMVWRKSGK